MYTKLTKIDIQLNIMPTKLGVVNSSALTLVVVVVVVVVVVKVSFN